MSDHDHDLQIRAAFGALYRRTIDEVRPIGAAATLVVAQRRRGRRIAATACAVVLAVAIPVAVYASAQRPVPPPVQPATTGATSTYDPSPTPTETPFSFPTSIAPSPLEGTNPGELANATIPLDFSWPGGEGCPHGPTTFVNGLFVAPGGFPYTRVIYVTHTDVDHDGQTDVVAFIDCRISEAGSTEVVAYTPRADGTFRAIGTVQHSRPSSGHDGVTVVSLRGLSSTPDGTVLVTVRDRDTCCAALAASAVVQVRGYSWSGTAFRQTSGPTTFLADPSVSKVSMTLTPVVFTATGDGGWLGTVGITVTNAGPQPANEVVLAVRLEADPVGTDGDWARCPYGVCALGTLAAGQSVTVSLPVRSISPTKPAGSVGDAYLHAGQYWCQEGPIP